MHCGCWTRPGSLVHHKLDIRPRTEQTAHAFAPSRIRSGSLAHHKLGVRPRNRQTMQAAAPRQPAAASSRRNTSHKIRKAVVSGAVASFMGGGLLWLFSVAVLPGQLDVAFTKLETTLDAQATKHDANLTNLDDKLTILDINLTMANEGIAALRDDVKEFRTGMRGMDNRTFGMAVVGAGLMAWVVAKLSQKP